MGSCRCTFLKRNDGCAGLCVQSWYAARALTRTDLGASANSRRNRSVVWDSKSFRPDLSFLPRIPPKPPSPASRERLGTFRTTSTNAVPKEAPPRQLMQPHPALLEEVLRPHALLFPIVVS